MIDKIEKIKHYSITHAPSVYDVESMTALELAGRTAGKMNELIDSHFAMREEINYFTSTGAYQIVEDKVDEHIANGDFDRSINAYAGELEARVDNLLNNVPEGGTTADAELIDLRVGYDQIDADNAGKSIRNQLMNLAAIIGGDAQRITFGDMVPGYYSTGNGGYGTGDEWKRSRHKIPCRAGTLFVLENDVSGLTSKYALLACYDRSMAYIGSIKVGNAAAMPDLPRVTPPGTAFVGITVSADHTDTEYTIKAINAAGLTCIDHPWRWNNEKYIMVDGYWYSSGWKANADTAAIVFPVTPDMRRVYANMVYETNGVFLDGSGNIVTTSTPETSDDYGAVYVVPEGAALCVMNVLKSATLDGDTNHLAAYVTIIRDNVPGELTGKKILVIGDSIAWLDKKADANGLYPYEGFQAELRKRGAIVDTFAFSGYTYYHYGESGSIVQQYRQNRKSGYDIVILTGGSNDIREGVAIGELPASYDGFTAGSTDMLRSLGTLITMIYADMPDCDLYLCTPTATTSDNHDYSLVKPYREAFKAAAEYWHIPLIDLFTLFNHSVNYNTNALTYDGTHPNYRGMRKLGNIIAKFVENNTI